MLRNLATCLFLLVTVLTSSKNLIGQQLPNQPGIEQLFLSGPFEPLSEQVEWKLKNGLILRGKLYVQSVDDEFMMIRNESNHALIIEEVELSDEDQKVVAKILDPIRSSKYRIQDALSTPIPWKTPPQGAYQGLQLLAIEKDRLVGTIFGRVVSIDLSLVSDNSLGPARKEWETRFGSGKFRSFELKYVSPSLPFVGRPIATNQTDVLFELPSTFDLQPPLVRVPKFVFTNAQSKRISQLISEAGKQSKYDEKAIFELPCLRRTQDNWCVSRGNIGFTFEASQGREFQARSAMHLCLEDRVNYILNGVGQHLVKENLQNLDLQSPAFSTFFDEQRSPYAYWTTRFATQPIIGGVIGKLDGHFVMRLRDQTMALVHPKQLAPVDAFFAKQIAQGANESWSKDIDLEKLRQTRLFTGQSQVQGVLEEQESTTVIGKRLPIVGTDQNRQVLSNVPLAEFIDAIEILDRNSGRPKPATATPASKPQELTIKSVPGIPGEYAIEPVAKLGGTNLSNVDGSWKLTNGLVVTGTIGVSKVPNSVVVTNHSGDSPNQVVVDRQLFASADRATLQSGVATLDKFAFMEFLPSLDVKVRWDRGEPRGPAGEFSRVVYVDGKRVYAIVNDELMSVARDAIAVDCLREMERRFRELGSGTYLTIHRGVPKSIGVRPLVEDETGFVIETGRQPEGSPIQLPPGSRIRLPKYLLSAELAAILRTLTEKAKNPVTSKLTADDIRLLPCLRMMGDEMVCCLPPRDTDQARIEVLRSNGASSEAFPKTALCCLDQWEWEKEGVELDGNQGEIEEAALVRVVASSLSRSKWKLKNAIRCFDGKLLGAVADGFVFELTTGVAFFVYANELSDTDLKVCSLLETNLDSTWHKSVDFTKLFRSRVVLCNGLPIHCYLDAKRQVSGCVSGSFPKLQYLQNPASSIGQDFIHAESLNSVQSAMKFVEANISLLKSQDHAKIVTGLENLRGDRPVVANNKPIPIERPPELWTMRDGREFRAVLAGEFNSDFVFQRDFNGKFKFFLVAKVGLAPPVAARANTMVGRLPIQDWPNVVARAKNWQYFRLWYDESKEAYKGLSPVVVDHIGENTIIFTQIEGGIDSLYAETGEGNESKIAIYAKAIADGLKLREETASKRLRPWTFRECSATLYANIVADAGDRVLMIDVDNVDFLVGKANFDPISQDRIAAFVQSNSSLRKLDPNRLFDLNHAWCGRTELHALGRPIFLTSDGRLHYRSPEDTAEEIRIAKLTLREQLAVEYFLKRQTLGSVPLKKATDLASDVPAKDIVHRAPALDAVIKNALDQAPKWEQLVWESKPVKLDSKAIVKAVNGDATSVVLQASADSWNIVDLVSGKQRLVRDISKNNLGPWMSSTSNHLWWVENGQLMELDGEGGKRLAKLQFPKLIVAASQSGDFGALVLELEDRSIFRVELATMQREELRGASPNPKDTSTDRLWASLDGTGALCLNDNWQIFIARKSIGGQSRGSFVASSVAIRQAAVGNDIALASHGESINLLAQYAAPINVAPFALQFPFGPKWIGFVDLFGKNTELRTLRFDNESREIVQSIGIGRDAYSTKADYLLVHQCVPRGDHRRFAHQIIEGTWDVNSKVAANGAAILHQQSGKYVISRRPAKIPEALQFILARYVAKLMADRDIGQLEALAFYLHQPQFMKLGRYRGQIADTFHETVRTSALQFEAELPGDRLERAMQLASHLHEKFPSSQVAMNLQINLYRALAWDARGGGYAESVTDLGWESFKSNMSEAEALVNELMALESTMAQSFRSAIDIAMATGKPLDESRKIAKKIVDGPHKENVDLHSAVAFMLLPRWHGSPGMSESYITNVANRIGGENGDAIYAQLAQQLSVAYGIATPASQNLTLDFDRLVRGTKAYYQTHDDTHLLEGILTILALERKQKWIDELLQLRVQKRLL
jgi:hypothetical protein